MRIGFDIRPFLRQATGVGVYCKNLLFALAEIDDRNDYYLFSSSCRDRFFADELPPFSRFKFRDCRYPVKLVNFLWYRLERPTLDSFFRTELDLTHSPTPLFLPTRGRKVVTVHDLFFMDYPSLVQKEAKKHFAQRTGNSLHRADGILVVSQFIKEQIIERFSLDEKKIRVVHHGVSPGFAIKPSIEEKEAVRHTYGLPPAFLLFVGAIEPRKNLVRLAEALNLIHQTFSKIPLVIVGKRGRDYGNLIKKIRELNLGSHVLFLDYLPDKDLKVLYHLASCLVLPSLGEGFGLPLVEAMASGLPLAVSKAPALPEVAEDAALYFHPEKPEDLACQVVEILTDDTVRESLVKKGARRVQRFSWKITAEKTLDFYASVLEGRCEG
ncbi:MAG: glycosyltransferase family 1 protein [Candidatus Aminicenantes bacterium]|jgi:glycosyltransferase involved in cell wall biosynthesis